MRRRSRQVLGTLVAGVLLYGGSALAVGGDDGNTGSQVIKATELCAKEVGLKGRIWAVKRIDTLNGCLDAILRCDEQKNGEKATDCRRKLIEKAKGNCSEGKLDSGATTLGAGAAAGKTGKDKPTLDKELAKYRDALQKKCFDAAGVDLTAVTSGLGFPGSAAADADALADEVNADPGGIGCLANATVLASTPLSTDDIAQVAGFEDATHALGRALKEGPGNMGLKSCAGGAAGPVCGNGVTEGSETCDDGNTVDESTVDTIPPDPCPANCTIAPCDDPGGTFSVDVNFGVASGVHLAGYKIFVDYPEDQVQIAGIGQTGAGVLTNDPTVSAIGNDLDYGLIVVAGGINAIPPSRLLTVNFQRCNGATPTAGQFACVAHQASDTDGNDVPMTCTIAVVP
jgi:hypothetical protein